MKSDFYDALLLSLHVADGDHHQPGNNHQQPFWKILSNRAQVSVDRKVILALYALSNVCLLKYIYKYIFSICYVPYIFLDFLPSCLSKIIKVLRKSFCVQLLIERCELREFCESSVLEICHWLRWMQEGRRDSEGVGGGRGLKQTMLFLKRATAKQTNELASKTIACSMLLGAKPAQNPRSLSLQLPPLPPIHNNLP